MQSTRPRKPNVLLWTVVFGVLLNLFGWLGNVFILGDAWDAASEGVKVGFTPPWPSLVHELMTAVSDFIYAFALVWFYANSKRQNLTSALTIAFIIWVAGVVVTYLAIVNSGFLPWGIAVKTSILALTTFMVAAFFLPLLVKSRDGISDG
jgi:hypothetical protein